MSGKSKCSDSWLHEGIRLHYTQINLERPAVSNTTTSASWRRYRDQKASVLTDEESNMFEIRKRTKQGDPLSSLLFNAILQYSLKDDILRWQKKKGMGIYLSDNDRDLQTTCYCLLPPKNRYGKCCVTSRKVLKKWDSGVIQKRRKFSATRPSSTRTQKRNLKLKTWKSKYWQEMKAWNI